MDRDDELLDKIDTALEPTPEQVHALVDAVADPLVDMLARATAGIPGPPADGLRRDALDQALASEPIPLSAWQGELLERVLRGDRVEIAQPRRYATSSRSERGQLYDLLVEQHRAEPTPPAWRWLERPDLVVVDEAVEMGRDDFGVWHWPASEVSERDAVAATVAGWDLDALGVHR